MRSDDVATPDFEWHNAPGLPGGDVRRGREAVKASIREYLEAWETYTVEEERVIDAGEQIVQLCRLHATGKGSGVTLDMPIAYVHTLRDGKFARTMVFLDHWRSPRSRRAAGVGDVARERGHGAPIA
jgi:ketosteroid isomerase-like protein